MSEMRAGRTAVFESRQPGRNFALYVPENRASIYVDGLAAVIGGSPVSSLDFFVVTDSQPDSDPSLGMRETREVRFRLTMPTTQLIESVLTLLVGLHSNVDSLVQANDETSQKFAQQIERLRALNLDRANV